MSLEFFLGQTFSKVIASNYQIDFVRADGSGFRMVHHQECCESVYIESIVGDLKDLEGEPILVAEESNNEPPEQAVANALLDVERKSPDDSHTWTFYKFATRKGYVDIRWYGSSNGYYSESVDIETIVR